MVHGDTVPRYELVHEESSLDALRTVFRSANRYMVFMWRLGLGRWAESWPGVGGRMLVLEHRGRSSGRVYRTPLNFTPGPGSAYCVAAFGPEADWYRNALAATDVTVWLPGTTWRARPIDVSSDPRRLHLIRSVLVDSGIAAPAFGINPRKMSDAELQHATRAYRVVRFDLVERSDDRQADLAWMWGPAAAALMTFAGVCVRVRRRRRTS